MDKIFKRFKAEVKEVNEKDKIVTVSVSSGDVDRDGEIVKPEAFSKRLKHYKEHPVLLSSHDYHDLRKQIGKAISIKVVEGVLVAKFQYFADEGNDEADWGFKLAQKGIAGYSIGFIPHQYKDNDYDTAVKTGIFRVYDDVELIEISQVLVPSNRSAVMGRAFESELCELAVKSLSKDDFKSGEQIKEKPESFADAALELDEIKKEIKSAVKEALQEYEENKKHYSSILFGDGRDSIDAKHTPSEGSDDCVIQLKNIIKGLKGE